MENKLISSYFQADHDRLDVLFRNFQIYKRTDSPRARTYFRNFSRGLKRHIVWEEEVLFPMLEAKLNLPKETGPIQAMRIDHRRIAETLERVHEKVRNQNPESDFDENELINMLKRHNHKEESMLYPGMDRVISEQEAADLFRDMEDIPEDRFMVCCGTHVHTAA